MKFNVQCKQKLNDGDTALVEDYKGVDRYDVVEIMHQYYQRSMGTGYVDQFTITVDIDREG